MNTAATTAVSILGVLAAIWAAYVAAKSNARETRRARSEEIVNAVRTALEPKEAEIRRKDAVIVAKDTQITDLKQTIRDRDRRIEQLEDDLRRGGR